MLKPDRRILIVSPLDDNYFNIVSQLTKQGIETARVPDENTFISFHGLPYYFSGLMFNMDEPSFRHFPQDAAIQAGFLMTPRIGYYLTNSDYSTNHVYKKLFQHHFPVQNGDKPISDKDLTKIVELLGKGANSMF